jgi:hypothetical protein
MEESEARNDEVFFPEPKIHDYLCGQKIIAGNPEIAPAISLGNMTKDDINILFTLKEAKTHCKSKCKRRSCQQIIDLFDKKRIQIPTLTLG